MGAPVLNGPFKMPMFRDWVPECLRPWIYVLFSFAFQLSGGVYLGSLNEMVGGMSWMREDIMMCMYANLLGMAMYFPLLFRMKFCFTNRTLLLASSLTIVACNLLVPFVRQLPLLWLLCFIEGIAKIQGTFECMSNIQLWITPKRDFGVFFPVLHIVILCSMQFSDLLTTGFCYYYHWTFMHGFITVLMTLVFLAILVMTRHFRFMRKFPLFGIDWGGALLWATCFFEMAYIFNYGDWYDYWNSPVIRTVTVIMLVTLAACIHRMYHIRHPYYEPKMWTYKHLFPILILITIVEFILATEHVLEEIFLEEGMKYESMVSSQLDWLMIVGILLGCGFSLLWLKVLRFNYYRLLAIGFGVLACYLMGYYFTINTGINIEKLYAPTVARGFAYAVLSATFMLCLEEVMTFQHFFQSLSVFNVLHMLMGGVIGGAVYSKALSYFMSDNMERYSAYVTDVAFTRAPFNFGHYMEHFVEQMLMVSVKQVYGCVTYFCIFMFFALLLWDMPKVRSTFKKIPQWKLVGRQMKKAFNAPLK